MALALDNRHMLVKLAVVAAGMFGFGYALVPVYKALCEMTGLNILALTESESAARAPGNSQVDLGRLVTVEFDANTRGPWRFRPDQRSLQVHPGEMVTVMYEFENTQDRRMAAQAIPSYAPQQARAYFNKIECFCFQQYTLEAGEKKRWPVVFVIDPRLSRDVATITLSYTFFEVGAPTPPAPQGARI
jgi:cytochrome c oxidase assembly protein subunit 11